MFFFSLVHVKTFSSLASASLSQRICQHSISRKENYLSFYFNEKVENGKMNYKNVGRFRYSQLRHIKTFQWKSLENYLAKNNGTFKNVNNCLNTNI
jgi:hypothetical protein